MKKLLLLLLLITLAGCLLFTACTPIQDGPKNDTPADDHPIETPPEECGHFVTNVKGKIDATCTSYGYTGDTVCYSCGTVTERGEETPKEPHKFRGDVCIVCGCENPIPPTPPHIHSYTPIVTAPTCTSSGYTTYTCECKSFYVDDKTEALGHSFSDGECTACGAEDPDYVPPHTHSHTATVTAPTCTSGGYTTYLCVCGDVYVADKTEALGHSFSDGECTVCGEADTGYVPPHTHSHTATVTAPTCTSGGYTTYLCVCGDVYITDKTASLGHIFIDGECTVCGAEDPNRECESHIDTDDNGYCDVCSEYVIVIIDIFGINDLHGKISATDSQPGIGGLTTYLKQTSTGNAIFLSSGDMWQGTSESNLTYGALITDWMSALGFASMTLGNHEYDWGESYITSNSNLANFPFLAINVYDKSTGERAEYVSSSVVIKRGDVEIGIIGAIGDCYSSISGDVTGNFYFKVGSELTALVKAESERLRAQGVDFIIFSVHDDYSAYDDSLSDGYVDLVFEGHSHSSYSRRDSYGVYHLQNGGENKGIAKAVIRINSANGNTGVETATIVSSSTYGAYEDDALIAELLDKYAHLIDKSYEVLGYNSQYRDDEVVEQKVADLYYEFGLELWGDAYDITLGGGFIRTRTPYNLYTGEVLYSDVYSLLPFDNNLVLCSISGKDLLDKFINTTNSDYFIASGMSLSELKNSIKSNATYYIITDTYTSSYAKNRLTEIARYTDSVYARDLLAEYIKEGHWS